MRFNVYGSLLSMIYNSLEFVGDYLVNPTPFSRATAVCMLMSLLGWMNLLSFLSVEQPVAWVPLMLLYGVNHLIFVHQDRFLKVVSSTFSLVTRIVAVLYIIITVIVFIATRS